MVWFSVRGYSSSSCASALSLSSMVRRTSDSSMLMFLGMMILINSAVILTRSLGSRSAKSFSRVVRLDPVGIVLWQSSHF